MKTCNKCGRGLPLTEFFRHSHYADGYRSQCKMCHREGVERVPDELRPQSPCACGCGTMIFTVDRRGRPRDRAPGHVSPPLTERLWSTVDKDGPVHPRLGTRCWLWLGSLNEKGYGTISDAAGGRRKGQGHTHSTHRVSWELENGAVPDGLHVLHHCDVKNCVRPDHLYLGTNDDNVGDRVDRGRSAALKGEDNPQAKLTEVAVREIRRRYESEGRGVGVQLATEYGVSISVINNVARRITWRHVE